MGFRHNFDFIDRKTLHARESLLELGDGPVLSEAQRLTFMEALWFHAVDARYLTIKAAHAKTCRWLLQKPEYKDWLDINKCLSHRGLLWIKGKPGSGKSTLMKFIVADARKWKAADIVISFFFNARGEELEKSTFGMYRSLLYQLLKALPDLQVISKAHRTCFLPDGTFAALEEADLKEMFATVIQHLKERRLICFIDALDECEENEIRDLVIFLEKLEQLAISSQIRLNFCLSSRHYPHISIAKGVQLVLEGQEGHVQDIARYLNGELRAGDGKQVEAIKEEILTRASGIFLWVALVVQILNREYDHGRVHALSRRLREIPDGLDKLFEDILTRDRENLDALTLCLQWILYAKRPLRREELYYAILSGTDHETLCASHSNEATTQDMERFILSCSKGLAETTKLTAQTVQFIHESVRDFLLGKTGINKLEIELGPGQSQERLKQCCYTYLETDISEYVPPSIDLPVASSAEAKELRTLVSERHPFLEYAVHNVLIHADIAGGHGLSQKNFVNDFTLDRWIGLENLFERYQVRRYTSNASLLYIAAEKSLINLVRIRLEQDSHPETAGERFESERYAAPLYAALANAKVSDDVVRALLIPVVQTPEGTQEVRYTFSGSKSEYDEAAITTIMNYRPILNPRKGQDLIGWAASEGHEAVIKTLLARSEIELNLKDKNGHTPLSKAVLRGHEAAVKLLLAREDADPNSNDNSGRTPLSLAASNGYDAIAMLLLARDDIDADLKDNGGQTPLSKAVSNGHEAVVSLLLTRDDIDLDLKNNRGQTPLLLAASNGYEAVVHLLLSKDNVDLNSKDNNGQTPLSLAASNGHEAVVSLLLARDDVDPDFKNNKGQTLLLLAASNGHEAVISLLLARDNVDPNSKDNSGQTPLSLAASNGHKAVVSLLLAKDNVDPNSTDKDGQTPLSLAASHGHEAVVSLLLARDNVDPNSKDYSGWTPLSLAALNGHEAVVSLLLSKDNVDPNSKDNSGWTPLLLAFGQECSLPVRKAVMTNSALMDYQTQLMLLEQQNKRRLFMARIGSNNRFKEAIVKQLLARDDVDPDLKNYNGQTPLSLAASNGREAVVSLLLAKDNVDSNSKDKDGQTPLSLAASNGREAVVSLLLAKDNVDLNSKDKDGQTPLSLAASNGHKAVVSLLLARDDIDPDLKNT